MTAKLNESAVDRGCMSMLPHASAIEKHFRCVFSAPRLTPAGDVIWCLVLHVQMPNKKKYSKIESTYLDSHKLFV